jgi:superfamily II DNA helicase RecQ
MNYKIFSLSAAGDETTEQHLNAFLTQNKVIQVDRQFVAQGELSYWSMCVSYQPGITVSQTSTAATKKPRIDYKEVLTEAQFSHYAALRELRKQMAEQDGVPVFAVFTNEQLAKIVQQKVQNAMQLKAIEGIGESKLNRYGNAFLQLLHQLATPQNA